MFWCDDLIKGVEGPQVINDSKTPSGRVHVGALRGVLIHDAVFRVLKENDIPVRYLFGVDDYDAVDELPAGTGDFFKPYLGVPLCQAPPPPGSDAPSMAEHFIGEFFDVFAELDAKPEIYRTQDLYRSGQFNPAIDAILSQADKVRKVYAKISGSERPAHWHPFQVICESCGKIGTTEVRSYEGREVTYRCRKNLVSWATGCGHEGKISPFDGNGKLPWKLEWVAKWVTFPVTIEGAGKDHSTRGGSRDVSELCLREIFGHKPPLNIPYEFFLVGGAKMSSSKGLGASAREMANFLPPEILRFLMIRPKPNKPVNFEPDEKNIIKLFNEFDRFHSRVRYSDEATPDEKRIVFLSDVRAQEPYYIENFQIVSTLVQMPHLDVVEEVTKRKGSPLTDLERQRLERRIQSARYWLDHYALDEEKTVLQETLPERAETLSQTQRAFLHRLADRIDRADWTEDALQSAVFEAARTTPIRQPLAFQAFYRVLLDRDSGPKAGNLMALLDADFLLHRLRQLSMNGHAFALEAGMEPAAFVTWLSEQRSAIDRIEVDVAYYCDPAHPSEAAGIGVLEVSFSDAQERRHRKLVSFPGQSDEAGFIDNAKLFLASLDADLDFPRL